MTILVIFFQFIYYYSMIARFSQSSYTIDTKQGKTVISTMLSYLYYFTYIVTVWQACWSNSKQKFNGKIDGRRKPGDEPSEGGIPPLM